ncbi:MAG: hypothetical protein MUF42_14390 [Cytophagaceae bacterium]|jgi:hypothetical protein|nr:hypothetical protein [Cytophagaceae bacterium]
MNEEALLRFLYFYYEAYVQNAFASVQAEADDGSSLPVDQDSVISFLLSHLDIYLEHASLHKEYEAINQTRLLYNSYAQEREAFAEFELFLIDNFHLFAHTLTYAALSKKHPNLKKLKLSYKKIDNVEVKLLDLVQYAEKRRDA